MPLPAWRCGACTARRTASAAGVDHCLVVSPARGLESYVARGKSREHGRLTGASPRTPSSAEAADQ